MILNENVKSAEMQVGLRVQYRSAAVYVVANRRKVQVEMASNDYNSAMAG